MSTSPPPASTSSPSSSSSSAVPVPPPQAEVTFSLESFSKVVLHVTKYPHYPVNGLLIRKKKKGGSSSSNNDEGEGGDMVAASAVSKKLVIQDAIPLLHLSKYTTPMMEIALAQSEQYCRRAGCEIVGYYQANESLKDNGPDFVASRISQRLAEINPNLMVVMVNNERLNSNLECSPFTLYQWLDGKLKPKEAKIILQPDEDGALSTVSALIQAKVYKSLVDFDNHMEDISLNYWVNPVVNEMVERLRS